MRVGALLTPVNGHDPNDIVNQARALEGEGYSSIWSAQAMGRGFMMTDPFIALSAAAAVTDNVELGTAILQLPLYNAADVALKSYSLAQLSGGRFILGIGAGSTESDYALHEAAFSARFRAFEKKLSTLHDIFSTGTAGSGELRPWEAVVDGVPLFFGTWGKNVARAALEFDGWIASSMHRSVDQVVEAMTAYRQAGGGRALVSTILLPPGQDIGELREKLSRYKEAGFDDAIVMFLPDGPGLAEVSRLVSDL